MLQILFRTFDDRDGEETRADAFVLDHAELQALPDRRVIARQADHQWQVGERLFLRFECRHQVLCVLQQDADEKETHGPFALVTCVDGVLWAGAVAVAHLRNRQWISLASNRAWPYLRLLPSQ